MAIPGRRTFLAASGFLTLTGVLHAVGFFTYKETDPARQQLEHALAAARMPLGMGMAPSMLDLQSTLTLTVAVCWAWLGVLGIVMATVDTTPRSLRRLTFVQLVGCAVLVLLFVQFRVPPPLVSFALVETLFVLSLLRQAIGFTK